MQRWGYGSDCDCRLKTFDDFFEEWFKQIPNENHSTVTAILENLEYYSHRTTNNLLEKIHNNLMNNKEFYITDDNTIYVFIKSKDGLTNSSNDYWMEYKNINNINKNICIENMDMLDEDDMVYITNIVFVDDFSGTGKSFINELRKCPSRYRNKNIHFVTISIMFDSINKISKYCAKNDINIYFHATSCKEKAFESNIFENNKEAKKEICAMSFGFDIPKSHIMGFEDSQALVVFYNNTPNNTLGFIRFDNEKYKSIFPRRNDKVPGWMDLKKKRQKQNMTNYSNKVRSKEYGL